MAEKKSFGTKKHETASGESDYISVMAVALGTLLTGQQITNQQSDTQIIGIIKGQGRGKSKKGILKLLEDIAENTKNDAAVSGGTQSTSKAASSAINIDGKGFADVMNAISSFKLSSETQDALEDFADMTKDGGALNEIFKNLSKLGEMRVNFANVSQQIGGINSSVAEISAIDGKVDAEKIKSTMEMMEPAAKLIAMTIGLGTLLVAVGLLSKYMDFEGILMFSGILLGFLLGLVGIFILANKYLEPHGDVFTGVGQFIKLVIVSAAILLLGSFIIKFIDTGSLVLFEVTLLTFMLGLALIYKIMASVSNVVNDGIKQFTLMVIASAAVLFLGAYFVAAIPFKMVLMFVAYLGLFLLGICAVLFLWNFISKKVMNSLADAMLGVMLAAFIMFFGAATVKALDVIRLLQFVFYLGVFLFGISVVLLVTSLVLQKEMKGVRDAIILVMAASFIMFLGAAVMKLVDKKALRQFIITLDLFLFGILKIVGSFAKKVGRNGDKFAQALKSLSLLIVIASGVLLGAGYLLTKYPKLRAGVSAFLVLFGVFMAEIAILLHFITGKSGAGIGFKGFKPKVKFDPFSVVNAIVTMHAISEFLVVSTLCMVGAGWAIAENPHLAWAIPVYLAILTGFVYGMYELIRHINTGGGQKGKQLTTERINRAKEMMRMIEELLFTTSISFLILAKVYKIVEKAGGMGGFTGLIGCVVGTVAALAGMVYLLATKVNLDSKKGKAAMIAMGVISGVLFIVSLAFKKLGETYEIVEKSGGMWGFAGLVVLLNGTMLALSWMIIWVAGALGNGAVTIAAYAAIGVILAMAGAMWIVSDSLLNIAKALKELSMIKSFDAEVLIESMKGVLGIVETLAPLADNAWELMLISNSLKSLTKLVSEMAEAVQEYADLKIGIYEGTKLVGYRHLDPQDFEAASTNVSLIVTTLTEGIMKAYEAHPEWYGYSEGAGNFWETMVNGGSALARVIKTSKELGPLISKIAEAVKDYADLKVPSGYDKEGNPTGYRSLTTADFASAATNVAELITVLSKGIMKAYEKHPEWYGFVPGKTSFGDWLLNDGNPMSRVIATSKELGPLISSIAAGVKDYADLKLPTGYDKDGKATGYKVMSKQDFKTAADNIKKVLLTIGNGIMKTYEKHKEWFEEGLITDSPFMRVVNTNKEVAKLITDVANGIKDYAELKMPTGYDNTGKPTGYKILQKDDFKTASENITLTLLTIGNALMKVYDDHNEWFADDWFSDSPFMNVINVNKEVAKLISEVSLGIKDYADLKMPDFEAGFDENGKPKGYKQMVKEDFEAAGQNIGLVVTTAALGLMGYNPDGSPGPAKQLIDEYFLADDDDKYEAFNKVLDASVKIGTVISSLAEGISHFSEMMFPTEWNPETGQPVKFKELNSNDFKEAANCITTVITTVADALIQVVKNDAALPAHEQMWNIDDEFEKSPLFKILSASEKMGQGITNIASGLAEYANMKFATGYDKDGKATGYQRLSEGDLKKAATKITDVIELVAQTMKNVYDKGAQQGGKNIWDVETNCLGMAKDEMSPAERVLNASVKMGQIIEGMAKGISAFAQGNMGTEDHPVIIDDNTLKLAKESITDVLKNTATTIAELATKSPTKELFEDKNLNVIVAALSRMNTVVKGAADGVMLFAALRIPTGWDKDGVVTGWEQMDKTHFDTAKERIHDIITCIGNAFNDVVSDAQNSWLKEIDDSWTAGFSNFLRGAVGAKKTHSSNTVAIVMNSVQIMAVTLAILYSCIYGYATMRFPKGINQNGQMEYSEPLKQTDLKNARTNIVKVITLVATAMMSITTNPALMFMSKDSEKDKVSKLTDYIGESTESIVELTSSIKDMVEDENVQALSTIITNMEGMTESLTKLANNFGDLLMVIFGGDSNKYGTTKNTLSVGVVTNEIYSSNSFADIIIKYGDKYDSFEEKLTAITDSITSLVSTFIEINAIFKSAKSYIKELETLFKEENFVSRLTQIIVNIGSILGLFNGMNSFDKIFLGEGEGFANFSGFTDRIFTVGFEEGDFAENKDIEYEIKKLTSKLTLYIDFINDVLVKLINVGDLTNSMQTTDYSVVNETVMGFFGAISLIESQVSGSNSDNVAVISEMISGYANALNELIDTSIKAAGVQQGTFDSLVNGIISINISLNSINVRSYAMFKLQNVELAKFVKTINAVQPKNITNLNKFVTSLNELAKRMGNLDNLTDAIANRLSVVLEELVNQLVHAETTIMEADKIQERRHELIKDAVAEVSTLMQQPMVVEVQNVSPAPSETPTNETPTETPT